MNNYIMHAHEIYILYFPKSWWNGESSRTNHQTVPGITRVLWLSMNNFFLSVASRWVFPKGPWKRVCVLSTCEYIRLNWISNRHRVQFSIKNLLGLFSYRDVKTLLGTLSSPQHHGLIGSWLWYGILDYISLSRSGLE